MDDKKNKKNELSDYQKSSNSIKEKLMESPTIKKLLEKLSET